jgi:hypothetical protein
MVVIYDLGRKSHDKAHVLVSKINIFLLVTIRRFLLIIILNFVFSPMVASVTRGALAAPARNTRGDGENGKMKTIVLAMTH